VDFIVKLPLSKGFDTLMTITDHDCTKAVILVPCKKTIDMEGVAKLFKDWVFPFMGLPKKIISDRDTRFTSTFFQKYAPNWASNRTSVVPTILKQMGNPRKRTSRWKQD
jgi:hypothetical protein